MNDIMEMPSGKWINKINGEVIEVRDTFIEGDNMILTTNKGMMTMDEFSRYYIQVSEDIYDLKGTVIDNKPVFENDYKQTTNDYYPTEIKVNNIPEVKQEIIESNKSFEQKNNIVETNDNYTLIKKIFDKKPITPNVSLNFECDNLPIDELKMLVNVFDVSPVYISDYFMENFVNLNEIKEQMKKYIKEKIK